MNRLLTHSIVVCSLALGACATSPFPSGTMKDVDPSVEFGVLKAQPDVYKGRVVQLAGRIVEVEPVKEGTLIVARSLPIVHNHPFESITVSESASGRFTVLYPGKINPADVVFGNEFMVVAQVQSGKSKGEPYVVARCLHVWKTGPLDEIADFPDWLDTYQPLEERTYCAR